MISIILRLKDKQVLTYFQVYTHGQGYPPTLSEAARACRIGYSALNAIIYRLELAGRVRRERYHERGVWPM